MSRDELRQCCADAALASRLDNMLANLDAHIEARAQQLAQPLIAKAHADAFDEVKAAQDAQQRAEDLVAELRRQIRALDRQRDGHQQRADKAEAVVERIRKYIDEEFRFWCSPHGVVADYAKALLDVIDREAGT